MFKKENMFFISLAGFALILSVVSLILGGFQSSKPSPLMADSIVIGVINLSRIQYESTAARDVLKKKNDYLEKFNALRVEKEDSLRDEGGSLQTQTGLIHPDALKAQEAQLSTAEKELKAQKTVLSADVYAERDTQLKKARTELKKYSSASKDFEKSLLSQHGVH